MKIVLHGILAERYGREFEIETNVPADAIEGLTRQLPDWPRDLRIAVLGYDTEEKLRAQTDDGEIHLLPAMFGGGGKFFQIILGAAMVVAGVVLTVTGNPQLGVPLIVSGATMMVSGIAQLFMKAPTTDKANDPDASKYLGNNKNTVAIGTLMPNAWGRITLAGQWLSIQIDSNNLVTTSFPATTS